MLFIIPNKPTIATCSPSPNFHQFRILLIPLSKKSATHPHLRPNLWAIIPVHTTVSFDRMPFLNAKEHPLSVYRCTHFTRRTLNTVREFIRLESAPRVNRCHLHSIGFPPKERNCWDEKKLINELRYGNKTIQTS